MSKSQILNAETEKSANYRFEKTFNQDFVDAYNEGIEWKQEGCCHDFDVGQSFISDGHMPEGFSDWAWSDIQKYVIVLARGGNMLGTKPGTFVTNCTDGFRPSFSYLSESMMKRK